MTTDNEPGPDLLPTLHTGAPIVVARSGAELVEVSERYYTGVFSGAIVLVALSALFALALLPTRKSVPSTLPPVTIVLAVLLVLSAPVTLRRSTMLYQLLRRQPALELVLVVAAAALVAYPLRSELWWPSCGLLMLLATLAPLPRALGYCLTVLLANLAAHILAGDIEHAPAVSIIGLWIGLVFWTLMFGIVNDRLAAFALRVNSRREEPPPDPVRVRAQVLPDSPPSTKPAPDHDCHVRARSGASTAAALAGLTARQLQVVALLTDGLRYRDIAQCLSISERQVQRHVSNAMTRLGVSSTGELAALAVSEGLVPIPSAHPASGLFE